MVSQSRSRPASATRDRLVAAAAAEFAARGFDGAKVDRIARKARVNKAMLYYHFTNKAALYRAILIDLFQGLAAAVAESRGRGGPADEQLRRFIRTIAAQIAAHPHFPAIWLREMAEGGRHLDSSVFEQLVAILQTLGAILEDGRRAGRFARAHPLVTQLGIVGPLLLFTASAPIRERFQQLLPGQVPVADRAEVVARVEAATLAALTPSPLTATAETPARPRRRT